ncbi:cation diffusion facilitator family transporter [Methanohalophilus levihalophilus]|uniref:cation diffusion facilitator family transporter n=1 Tax=Methanohalophilus levihalophilus TaxID=1431282 RepID=UPI001AE4D7DE|nr:cation diffusion facilitator family transporter [Methanohalophilus levihalophilus]MBP2029193.1 cation diffusion facilitator family transporter [Methanohalophilus levihalophilus]
MERYAKIRRILILVLVLNLAVSFAKIVYGSITNTLSMQSDGYHSLFDGISNIVGIIGIQIASRPPDESHPYGHQKYETLASVFIAVLLVFVAFEIISQSVERFATMTTPEITTLSFVVMIVTIGINLAVTTYEKRKGEELKSEVLIADSMHTRSDIYVSLSVIAGLLAIKFGYPIVDPLIALIIAALIGKAAIDIIRSSTGVLCDEAPLDNDFICDIAKEVPGVLDCHKIRTRGTVGDYYIDLHIWVNPELHVSEAHRISHMVTDRLKEKIEGVDDVVVHIEPGKHK